MNNCDKCDNGIVHVPNGLDDSDPEFCDCELGIAAAQDELAAALHKLLDEVRALKYAMEEVHGKLEEITKSV